MRKLAYIKVAIPDEPLAEVEGPMLNAEGQYCFRVVSPGLLTAEMLHDMTTRALASMDERDYQMEAASASS